MLFWKINNIQRRKILNPFVYIADFYNYIARSFPNKCFLWHVFPFYFLKPISILHGNECINAPYQEDVAKTHKVQDV